jgi:hypothetical protein
VWRTGGSDQLVRVPSVGDDADDTVNEESSQQGVNAGQLELHRHAKREPSAIGQTTRHQAMGVSPLVTLHTITSPHITSHHITDPTARHDQTITSVDDRYSRRRRLCH